MLGKVFKAYDIRGTYPDPLDEKMAWQIGYGTSKFLLGDAAAAGETSPMMKNIVVGRDMRKSSPGLTKALIKGICDHGGHVIDVGLVDTSFIYFAVNHLDCAGGVMTTASHNPPQYNGFKISKRKAKPVGEATGLSDIRKHAAMVDRQTVQSAGGRSEERNLWEPYSHHVRSFLDLSGERRTLRVVIDASNGMAGTMIPMVFGKKCPLGPVSGLEIVEINFDNSRGEFVHEPNPLVTANLAMARERVVKEKADVGFVYDGDADRCVVIDETGTPVGCDHLTGVLASYFLKKHGKGHGVVFDLRSTKAVSEEIVKAGGIPHRSRVGHVFMKAAMAEKRCIFGGELSGHFYFRDNFNADSGAIAMCTVLSLLKQTGRKMSTLVAPMKRYAQSGEINFNIEDKDGALKKLREEFGSGPHAVVDELDGVTIDCWEKQGHAAAGPSGIGWWCNVRKSNTEPLLRLNLEAKDRKTLDTMLGKISPLLGVKVDH
ncbi:MAG: phosphomannomutase/phosphoglucomutase [Phycisphaerales bacterium]|nr:phosphomannomutase/phosphoglucomutase [Phycisphaerales bacterium]